ncbi:MAG: UbiD family decarboxylase, partial [Dehalococcoidia bacterium]|nr:UbiD family decarboxylase [Dehalococcoidia bacterium]
MAKDLRHFLDKVRALGPDYFVEVNKAIDPVYEMAVLQQKLAKKGSNPVILYRNVKGSHLPVVANLFGSYPLLGLALDVPFDYLTDGRYHYIVEEFRKRQGRPIAATMVTPTKAPVRQVIWRGNDIDLSRLPVAKHAELNADRYVDAGLTILRHPDSGKINVGIYRQQVKGPTRLACMIAPAHHGSTIARRYAELGKLIPVATAIGHHPAAAIAAGSTRPQKNEDELELIGGMLGESLEVTPGLTVDLPVPARAEIVIEGTIDPRRMESDGPFSEGAGYYGEGKPCYVIEITAITMRRDAIYHDLHPVHAEHNLVGILQREMDVFDRVRAAGVDVKAVHIGPDDQCGKLIMYVSNEKRSPDDARVAGQAAVARGFAKVAIVVDEDIDVYDQSEVLWAMATRARDAFTYSTDAAPDSFQGVLETNNRASRLAAMTSKLIIDATRPLDCTGPIRV